MALGQIITHPWSFRLQGGLYIFAGLMHFAAPSFYEAAMPPWLPFPVLLHYTAGVLEIVFGLGLFSKRYRKWAGLGLTLLLISFIQVHVWVLMPEAPSFEFAPPAVLWVRLFWQLVLILWAYSAYAPEKFAAT